MTGRTIKTIGTGVAGARALARWVKVCTRLFADSSPASSVTIRTHPYSSVEGGNSRNGGLHTRQRRRRFAQRRLAYAPASTAIRATVSRERAARRRKRLPPPKKTFSCISCISWFQKRQRHFIFHLSSFIIRISRRARNLTKPGFCAILMNIYCILRETNI